MLLGSGSATDPTRGAEELLPIPTLAEAHQQTNDQGR
jgi:hypothetical protein